MAVTFIMVLKRLEGPKSLVPFDNCLDLWVRVLNIRDIHDTMDAKCVSVCALLALQTDTIMFKPKHVYKLTVLFMLSVHLLNIIHAESAFLQNFSLFIEKHPDQICFRASQLHMCLQILLSELSKQVASFGFSDIISSPKQGHVHVPSATSRDKHGIRMALLAHERSLGGMGLLAPSSTYHHFAVGMTGSKMSSSQPKTTLFLRDDLASVEKKIKRAFSGGQATVEEHRRLGGNPDVDVAYQYMMYFFEEDDGFLAEVNSGFRSGKILAGEMKQLGIERASAWMSHLHEMRDQTAHSVQDFLATDSR